MKRDPYPAISAHSMATLPPVFVMNPYYTGLGIARSLRGSGVPVYALTSEPDAPGARSRFFKGVYRVPNGRDEPQKLCERLLEIRGRHRERPVLFPTRDFDIMFLHEYGGDLADAYILPQETGSPIVRMMDKLELATVAGACSIPVPQTMLCRSRDELECALARLRFPIVVKPRFAYQWRRKGVWEKVGAVKAIIVATPEELRARYNFLSESSQEVLLQEYIPGTDHDIVVCGCYISRNGRLLGHFTARKLRQNPPLVGTGCIVEATDVANVLELSTRLLGAFGYSGLAEVEFKYDRALNRFVLIEVNPRHWDQHELGTLVGVNLTLLAYGDMLGMDVPPSRPIYQSATTYKWIAEREFVQGMARSVFRELRASKAGLRGAVRVLGRAIADCNNLLRGKKIFGVMRLGDPLPSALTFAAVFGDALKYLANLRTRPDSRTHI